MIPRIKIREPLQWQVPYAYEDKIMPWLIFIFRVGIIGIVIKQFYKWNTWRKTITVNSKDYYKSSDIGLTAGAGLNVRLVKNTWFNADVNYLHGLTDIRPISKQHNRGVGINVGINFGL